jgi:Caspase domain
MTRLLISVGCNRYQHLTELRGAEEDARAIHAVLTGSVGEYDAEASRLLLSPTIQGLRDTFDDVLFAHDQIDVLTVFFAGHGVVKSGNYYLCLADTRYEKLSTTGLPLVFLFATISECYPQQVNIVIDACESGGAMHDMSTFMKPEVIGKVNSLSISFLAACTVDQYAHEGEEGNQAGVATTEILEYLKGERILQDTRPFLDLVELGRAVSTDVLKRRDDQTPVTWGLNLYDQGMFAKNPHYSGENVEFPLRVMRIAPNSDIGRRVQQYSEALWVEYRQIVTDPSNRRLLNLLSRVCSDLEGNGESCLPFIRGVATSLRARAAASTDLLAESDALACCAVALLPHCQDKDARSTVTELIKERSHFDSQAREALLQSLQQNRYNLLSPVGSAGDFYYLPIRVSRTLGWLGTGIIIDEMLGQSDGELRDQTRRLIEQVLEYYSGSLAAMSDEQASSVHLFSKACQLCGWNDLARSVLNRYFESTVSVAGAIARGGLELNKTLLYVLVRGMGQAHQAYKLLATPSEFIATLMLCGEAYGLAEDWDTRLIALDHKSVNFYLPDDYSSFGAERITNGQNYTFRIGNGVWSLGDLADEFKRNCWPRIVENETIDRTETQALCALSSYLFPDRVPYFLEKVSSFATELGASDDALKGSAVT